MAESTHREIARIPHREIVDPCLGIRWHLRQDPEHPGGPARLVSVQVDSPKEAKQQGNVSASMAKSASTDLPVRPVIVSQPIIRVGQMIQVEQRSATLHTTLQAKALESAVLGQKLRVQMTGIRGFSGSTAGAILSVVATGAGIAEWASATTSGVGRE